MSIGDVNHKGDLTFCMQIKQFWKHIRITKIYQVFFGYYLKKKMERA